MIKYICYLWCKAQGWKTENYLNSDLKQGVIVGYPHTSNWDFKLAMFIFKDQSLNSRFAIKKEWLKFPFESILTSLGAIGIDRDKSSKLSNTEILANLFKTTPNLLLVIAPEGSRSLRTKWKTGFYYIAQKANVPLITIKVDYKKKLVLIAEKVFHANDFETDMITLTEYFKGAQGANPENASIDLRFDK